LEKLQPEQMTTILERAITALGGVVEKPDGDDTIESNSSDEPR